MIFVSGNSVSILKNVVDKALKLMTRTGNARSNGPKRLGRHGRRRGPRGGSGRHEKRAAEAAAADRDRALPPLPPRRSSRVQRSTAPPAEDEAATASANCPQYSITGHCRRRDMGNCKFGHDPSKLSICRRFLSDRCQNKDCGLVHEWVSEKVPDCPSLLETGNCTQGGRCGYRHSNWTGAMLPKICFNFSQGFCDKGRECPLVHAFVCRNYKRSGKCEYKAKCFFVHIRGEAASNCSIDATGDHHHYHAKATKRPSEESVKVKEEPEGEIKESKIRRQETKVSEDLPEGYMKLSRSPSPLRVLLKTPTPPPPSPPPSPRPQKEALLPTPTFAPEILPAWERLTANVNEAKYAAGYRRLRKYQPHAPEILARWADRPLELKIEYDSDAEREDRLPIIRSFEHNGWLSTFYTRNIHSYYLL